MKFSKMGENIKKERKSQNLTQEQLAERVDISAVYLSQIENGRKVPGLETVYNITCALGISMENVFSEQYISIPKIDKRIEILLKEKTEKEKNFIFDIMNFVSDKLKQEKITF